MFYDFIIIGGGAAGIFAALTAKNCSPAASVLLLEKSAQLLSKVKISGGGRCNVTHHCFEPRELVLHYPRGAKELLGPFHHFQPRDTVAWFAKQGIELKTERDGRIFPVTDSSQTIIDCLLGKAEQLGVKICRQQKIASVVKHKEGFVLMFNDGKKMSCRTLLLATGSGKAGYKWACEMGHKLVEPVPSLFTFNIPTSPLLGLSGAVCDSVELALQGSKWKQRGPLLVTHFGFSGPAALKLSAWAARFLHKKNYKCELLINWLPNLTVEEIFEILVGCKKQASPKFVKSERPFSLPKKLWEALLDGLAETRWCDLSNKAMRSLSEKLHRDSYAIDGKTTNKEEFVTCGGVTLGEVNFKTMESKITPGLYFAGEILDIDGITGGFNFQNAWTTGFLAGASASCACDRPL